MVERAVQTPKIRISAATFAGFQPEPSQIPCMSATACVVGNAANGVEALALARERQPDVLLLDIAMPEVDGFDVARHLPEPRPLIIFQTAHDEFALRAFEHEALDYVVKPVVLQRLRQALERARKRLDASLPPALPAPLLGRIQSAIGESAGAPKLRLLVREDVGHRLVALADVARFTAVQGRTEAHLGGTRFQTDYTMAELETRTAGRFARTTRSDLVNLDHIERSCASPTARPTSPSPMAHDRESADAASRRSASCSSDVGAASRTMARGAWQARTTFGAAGIRWSGFGLPTR